MLGKIGTSIYGAYKSAKMGQQAQQAQQDTHTKVSNQLNARANQDYVNRSEIQGLLGSVRSQLNDRFKRARATNVVTGGTDESLYAMQQADNQLVADAISRTASNASTYKDKVLDAINTEDVRNGSAMATAYGNQAQETAKATGEANKVWDGIAKAFA